MEQWKTLTEGRSELINNKGRASRFYGRLKQELNDSEEDGYVLMLYRDTEENEEWIVDQEYNVGGVNIPEAAYQGEMIKEDEDE